MNMSQTDQRNGGMTTSAHQISIGVLNSGLPRTFHRVAVDARGVSTSPPGRRFSISGSDQRSRRAEPPRRQNSLTIRRLSWQLNSGNDSGQTNRTGSVSVARRICVHPDPAGRPPPHISVSADTVNRSIHTLTLIQPAPAISIMIGGAGSNPAGPRDKLTTLSESSNHSPKSPLQSIKESASFDLGIPVDSAAELLQNTSHTSFTVVPSSDTPCVRSPVSIEVGNAKPVLVCRPHDTISQRIFLGSLSDPPSVHRCDIISSRPPLPQVDADSKTGKTLVRISSGSRGLVVAASSSNEVHIVTPTVALRSRSPSVPRGILRPCGSCDNLLSRRLQLDTSTPAEFSPVKPLFHHFVLRGRSASEQDPPLHHRLSHGNLIEQLNCDMPNAPLPAGLGSAKASCLPHVGPNNQMSGTNAIPTRPRSSILSEAMSGDPTPPYTEVSGGIVGMPAMASVSSSGNNKPVASPGLGRIKHQRLSSSNSGSHQSQYFRVQLPCTRANARPKGFAPTDSLKLYEDQILNYSGAGAQRPQSWCIDLGQLGDEIALIDDSHSASPASTVSSRSSSSSDTSQSPSFNRNYHHPLPHIDRPYSAQPMQSRVFRWPIKVNSPPADSKRLPNEDTSTPVSTPTGNGPSKFGVSVHVEPQPPPLPPRIPSPSVLRSVGSVDRATSIPPKVSNGFQPKTKNEEIRNRSQPTSPHTQKSYFGSHRLIRSRFSERLKTADQTTLSAIPYGPRDLSGLGDNTQKPLVAEDIVNELTELTNNLPSSPASSSAPNSSCEDEPVQNSPPSVKHDTLLLPPPAAPSTQSSGNSDEQNCDPPSLNEDSLLLPPPAPWNTDDCSTSSFVTNSSSKTSGCKSDRNSSQGSFESGYHKTSNPISDNYPVRFPMHNRINSPKSHSVLDEVSVADDFTRTDELELGSEELSSMTDESTYAFSTLDSEYLAWMRLSVRDISGLKADEKNGNWAITPQELDSMSRSVVHDWVDLFNSNPLGLRLNFVDDSCRLAGTLRIYINLIKPVKMSLRQTMDMLPASPVDQEGDSRINGSASGGSKRADEGLKDLPSPARLVSFFLPRGTSKIMYITSSTTSVNTVQCLLDRFHIQESPRKFALYEHTLDGKTITVRKIPTSECPLLLLLNWARLSSSREEFYDRLTRKRIVLQENDACDINWNDFTAAELTNFLRILDKEEAEYRNAILYQYGLLRDQIERRMDEICSRANDRDQPKYGRVSVPCHPYAYQPPTSNSQQFGYVPNPMRPGFRMSDRSLSVDAESSAASV